jgi:hypothetical protein
MYSVPTDIEIVRELPAGRAEVLFLVAALMPSAGIVPSLYLHQRRLSAFASCAGWIGARMSDQPGGIQ